MFGKKRTGPDFSKMDLVEIQEFVSVIEETDDWDNADEDILRSICSRLHEIYVKENDGEAARLESFIREKIA